MTTLTLWNQSFLFAARVDLVKGLEDDVATVGDGSRGRLLLLMMT